MALFPKKIDGNTTIGVCVFGKHPAYADHLPLDLGDTGMLATRLRQTFYTNGLLTRVSDFDMLQKAGRAIPFGHFILYRDVDPTSPGAALIQLWPSRDSANRADIPMALAAVGGGVTIDWLLTQGADVLAEAEVRCKAAANMPELTGAIRAAGESLRNRAASAEGQSSGEDRTARAVARLGGDAGDESHRLRIVATLRAMRDYLPSGALERSATFDKPAAVRVSRAGQSPLEALADWSAVLDAALEPRHPRYFLIAPMEYEWIDLLIGEPAPKSFACIRSGKEEIAPVEPGRDELNDEFGRRAASWLQSKLVRPKEELPSPPTPPPPPPVEPRPVQPATVAPVVPAPLISRPIEAPPVEVRPLEAVPVQIPATAPRSKETPPTAPAAPVVSKSPSSPGAKLPPGLKSKPAFLSAAGAIAVIVIVGGIFLVRGVPNGNGDHPIAQAPPVQTPSDPPPAAKPLPASALPIPATSAAPPPPLSSEVKATVGPQSAPQQPVAALPAPTAPAAPQLAATAPVTPPAAKPPDVATPPAAPPAKPDPQIEIERQKVLVQAALMAAESDIGDGTRKFVEMTQALQAVAPDIYDFTPDILLAQSIKPPQMTTVDQVRQYKTDALAKITVFRSQAVQKALVKAQNFAFAHQSVKAAFAGWQNSLTEPDAELKLTQLAGMIHALKSIDASWPADPAWPAGGDFGVAAIYHTKLDASLGSFINTIAALPQNEDSALNQFNSTKIALGETSVKVARQFKAAADAGTALKNTAFPPDAAALSQLKTRLANAGPAPAGWPDAKIAAALTQVTAVTDALGSHDIKQLQKYSVAGGPPPLLLAVCVNWPAKDDDAQVDAAIYGNLKKGLGQLPPQVVGNVNDLWIQRIAAETNPAQADELLQLAQEMNLPAKGRPLAITYFNARLAELKNSVTNQTPVAQAEQAAKLFLREAAPFSAGNWPQDADMKQAISEAISKIQNALNNPRPGAPNSAGAMPADFAKDPNSADYIYTPHEFPDFTMRFRPVPGKPAYLSTTDVTVGWFIRVAKRASPFIDAGVLNRKVGPRTWIKPKPTDGIQLSPHWLVSDYDIGWADNPPAPQPTNAAPDDMTPMQYISPGTAMYAAAIVGCRLPRLEEWKAVFDFKQGESLDPAVNGNLQNWRNILGDLAKEHLTIPLQERTKNDFIAEMNSGAPGFANNNLWFDDEPRNAPTLFRDMRNNLAEWVFTDDPAKYPFKFDRDTISFRDGGGNLTPVVNVNEEAFKKAVDNFSEFCSTIGLSNQPAPTAAKDLAPSHNHQYFDIGFRLAVDAPGTPTGPTLADIVKSLEPVSIMAR